MRRLAMREIQSTGRPSDPDGLANDSKVVNSMVDRLARDHARFAEPLSRMTEFASALASSPADPRLWAEAIDAWSVIKSDLWHHLRQENALVFSWAKPRADVPSDLIVAQTREQRHIRKLVRTMNQRRLKS